MESISVYLAQYLPHVTVYGGAWRVLLFFRAALFMLERLAVLFANKFLRLHPVELGRALSNRRRDDSRCSSPDSDGSSERDTDDESAVDESAEEELAGNGSAEERRSATDDDEGRTTTKKTPTTRTTATTDRRGDGVQEKHEGADEEPLLTEKADESRFLLLPIRYDDIFDYYKRQVAQFWTVEEVSLTRDRTDWDNKLLPHERAFFECILAFFAPSDGIVGENLLVRFSNEIHVPEVRAFYGFQAAMENIHAEMYALLIVNLIPDERRQNELFRAFLDEPGIRAKVQWTNRWLESDEPFAVRLLAFAVVEGLLFSGSFASIFWLKKRGLLPGLTFSNELISRDEGLHCDFACLLYTRYVVHKLPAARVYEIVDGAVAAEITFFAHALKQPVGELSQHSMLRYVKFCADRLLVALGYAKLYGETNPFEFMDIISIEGKTNFFERKVGEYRHSAVHTAADMSLLSPIDETNIEAGKGPLALDTDF